MRTIPLGALVAAPVVALALTACAGPATTVTASSPAAAQTTGVSSAPASSAPASQAPATQTVTQTAPASSAPASQAPASQAPATKTPQSKCGTADPQAAFANNVAKVKQVNGWKWTPYKDPAAGYDPCSPLSWILITVEAATGSSPVHIMLFHNGEYLGTATAEPQGKTQVEAVPGTPQKAIKATYTYRKPGECNGCASGTTVATFTWDDAQQKVVMSGEVPPPDSGR